MTTERELLPMSQRELRRYHTLRLVREGRITGAQAAASLRLSERHVWWLLARLRQDGRRLPAALREQILTLARGKYAGLNTTHLTERLQAEGLPVSRVTVHRLLRAAGVTLPRQRRPPRHRARRPRKAQAGLSLPIVNSPLVAIENSPANR